MGNYLIRRLLQMIPTLLGVMLFVFLLFNWVGGDPAYVLTGKISSPEKIALIRASLGVDQPWFVQFWIFIQQVATFDFGNSWTTDEPVSQVIATRLVPSLTLLIPLTIIEVVVGVGLAMLMVRFRGTITDRMVMIALTASMSISILVYIIVLQYGLASSLGWFPVQGWAGNGWGHLPQNLHFALLPILIMVLVSLAPNLRLYRSFFLEEMNQPYVRTAKAKGLSERQVINRHVLRNAGVQITTFVIASLPALLVGIFLVERFFSIPGIGREVILAVDRSDFPLIKAVTVYTAIATMISNLLADVIASMLDPRVELK
jgi:peptide/nickel transport system permease protein